MYNLRYHIASLVSVFLALSLGLVLGGLIVQRGTFSGQTQSLVEGLRKEFSDLRQENKQLTADNAEYAAFSRAITDDWVDGKLVKRAVFVLTNTGRNDGLTAVTQAIEDAGGVPVVVTMRASRFGLDNDALRSEIESLAADPEKPEESIAASLAAEWAESTDSRPVTQALVDAGVITVEGADKVETADGREAIAVASGFVNVDAPAGKPDAAGIALQQALEGVKVPTVAAQSKGVSSELAASAADHDLPAIDTLGTDAGRYALVALMTGADPGYYGTAQRATALFPPFAGKVAPQ